MSDTFIDLLKEEYRGAVTSETKHLEDYESAGRLLGDARQKRDLVGKLLLLKGVDPNSVIAVAAPTETLSTVASNGHSPIESSAEGSKILNNTHAIFQVLRKGENGWVAITDLPSLTKAVGLGLTAAQVHKVLGRQFEKKRMEKDSTGKKVRQTKLGIEFSDFREPKAKTK